MCGAMNWSKLLLLLAIFFVPVLSPNGAKVYINRDSVVRILPRLDGKGAIHDRV